MQLPTTPLIAVDIIIELIDREAWPIVLIERKNLPHGWAIPGGFVDVGETLAQAAVREAKEETCLDITLTCLLGNYSDPGRDARHHTVSAVYIAQANGEPKAADDAAHLELFNPHELPETLAFDHNKILADYIRYLNTGRPAPLSY